VWPCWQRWGGYLARGAEFRRSERLAAYSVAAGTFQAAAYAGALLYSMHLTFGEKMHTQPHAATLWDGCALAQKDFRSAAARTCEWWHHVTL
jgi:hypothetical protein